MDEDSVTYTLCLPGDESFSMEVLRADCLAHLNPYLSNYMWHQDNFNLQVAPGTKEKQRIKGKFPRLEGKVCFGDNVEDEWYVISLLFELSRWRPELVIRVTDHDGEVLLIEAADVIPKWAQDPELAEARVYIHGGQVHLVPVASSPAELTPIPAGVPEIDDACLTVFSYPTVTRALDSVQQAIQARLGSYPDDWSRHQHYTHVFVPERLRRILRSPASSTLIPRAVQRLYLGDPSDLRRSKPLKHFGAKVGEEEEQQRGPLVKMGLTLTKCLYAMLTKCPHQPDRKALASSGWALADRCCPNRKWTELGAKLTLAFEMLVDPDTGSMVGDEGLFRKFISSLEAKGYFSGQLEGSRSYQALYDKALTFYRITRRQNPSIDQLESAENRLLEVEDRNKELREPDDDSWLNLEPESFDEMLKAHFLGTSSSVERGLNDDQVPEMIKNFMVSSSGYEGVDENDGYHNREEEGCDGRNGRPNGSKDRLDLESLQAALTKVLGIVENQPAGDDNSGDSSEVEEDWVDMSRDTDLQPEYARQILEELRASQVLGHGSLASEGTAVERDVMENIFHSFEEERGLGLPGGPSSTLLNSLMRHRSEVEKRLK